MGGRETRGPGTAGPGAAGPGAEDLSAELWRQREILELLLFKYDEEQLLMAAGRSRWLPHAAREIEKVVERLQEAGLSLSVCLADVAAGWGLQPDAELRAVAQAAPDELWRALLAEHADAIVALITEIRAMQSGGTRRAAETLRAVGAAPAGEAAATYTAAGRVDHTAAVARLIDASL